MEGAVRFRPARLVTPPQRACLASLKTDVIDFLEGEARTAMPPPPRELPFPARSREPALVTRAELDPVSGASLAQIDADWRESVARSRAGYARHRGPRTGRVAESEKLVRDAARIECLILTRQREFEGWQRAMRAVLDGVYRGDVGLLSGLERDILAVWRSRRLVICQTCAAVFERPEDLPPDVPARHCPRCEARGCENGAARRIQSSLGGDLAIAPSRERR